MRRGKAAVATDRAVLLVTDGGANCNALLSCEAPTCTVNLDGKCTGFLNCCETSTGVPIGEGCFDDVATMAAIEALAAAGVATIVVGLPGTEAYAASLDEWAVAGGRPLPGASPRYHAVPPEAGMAGVETTLRDVAAGFGEDCTFALPASPPALDAVTVLVDCVPVATASATSAGYVLSPSPAAVELTGEVCDQVLAGDFDRLDVLYGCPVDR